MIEMPLFEEKEWYLKEINNIFIDGRIKDSEKRIADCEKKKQQINNVLEAVISDGDFSCENKMHTLFDKLVLASYEELEGIYNKINGKSDELFFDIIINERGESKKKIKEEWLKIYYLYDKMIQKGVNTELVKKYEIKCCPYCNENYIFNRKKSNGNIYAMAQLDHFYPRDKFPIFSVSLYNLVPSCSACNHIKFINSIGISPHDHKYDFSNMRISYIPQSSEWLDDADKIKIQFKYNDNDEMFNNKMECNLKNMGIKSSYEKHTDYVQEILKKARIYGKEMRTNLLKEFPELFSSDEELLKIIFSNYIETKDLLKRPLSKMTQDLLRELEIII